MVVLIGEGGGGKTAILNELEKRGFKKATNFTTRKRRKEEENIAEYIFLSKEEFNQMWDEGKLVQRAEFCGEYYGITSDSLKDNIACISIVNSIKDIKNRILELNIKDVNVISFYIYVDEQERRKRMKKRGDSEEEIEKRIEKDRQIFQHAREIVDYTIVNEDLNNTVNEIIEKNKDGLCQKFAN
jgi:guanylate kinase